MAAAVVVVVAAAAAAVVVLLHAELARQSAFWSGRHPLSFQYTCGALTVQI